MTAGMPGAATLAAYDQARSAQYRQGLIERLVGTKEIAEHLVRADLGLVALQDLASQIEVISVAVTLEARDQFFGEVVRVPKPEIELLKQDLRAQDRHGIWRCLGRSRIGDRFGGCVNEQQKANRILVDAGRAPFRYLLKVRHDLRLAPPRSPVRGKFCLAQAGDRGAAALRLVANGIAEAWLRWRCRNASTKERVRRGPSTSMSVSPVVAETWTHGMLFRRSLQLSAGPAGMEGATTTPLSGGRFR